MKNVFRRVLNSGMGYLPFKIIEGIFGIISLSMYSYLLTIDAYGNYGIVNNTMMIIYLLSIGWFVFVAIRYVKEQKTITDKENFYSNVLALQGIVLACLILIYITFGSGLIIAFEYDKILLLTYILFFGGYALTQFYTHLLLYIDRRLMNVIIVVLSAVLKPILVFTLYKLSVPLIYILFIGHGLVDLVMGLIAFVTVKPYKYFKSSAVNKAKFREFFNYGFPLIGLTLTMYVLNVSDRYIIRFFYSKSEVGLYTPNYSLASAAFLMISYGLSRGFYPRLLTAWKDKDIIRTEEILASGIKNFLFIALPATTGMVLLSKTIGEAFISEKYAQGYSVIGFVAIGMFFLGLAEYANKEWELNGNTKPIFKNSIIAAFVNLVFNFIFIPIYGFIAAAVTTSFSFVIYFLICIINRKKEIHYGLNIREIISIIIANLVMIIAVVLSGMLNLSPMPLLAARVLIGVLSYMIIIIVLKVYDIKKILYNQERDY